MKAIVFAAAIALLGSQVHAQAGSWYIGGAIGYGQITEKGETGGVETVGHVHTRWAFQPEVGTFLTKNLQLGIGASLSGVGHDARTQVPSKYTTISIGGTVYLRNYFGNGSFRPFVGINASVLPGWQENTEGTTVTKSTQMVVGANLNAGFAYNLTERITVIGSIAALGFTHQTTKDENTGNKYIRTEYGADANTLGNRFNVGVYYTFRKRK
jgi:outer membrane protein W